MPESADADIEIDSVSQYTRTVRSSHSYKLPSTLPMFMANGMSFENWIFIFENTLDIANIPNELILPLLSSFLKDCYKALQLLQTYMRTHKTASKWEEFKTILQATFLPVDHVYRLREKLTNLKQGSNSFDQYNRACLNITTQLPGLQFEDVLFHYINGLSERLNYEVKSKSPRTIDAAIAIATQYDHIHAPSRPTADVKAISHRRRLNQGTTSGSKRFLNTNPTSSDKLN